MPCQRGRHASGSAADRAGRGLPHCWRGAAQRLPACARVANRSGNPLRSASLPAARSRRRSGHRRRGGWQTNLRRALRHGRHARARETGRWHAVDLERDRLRHRGGADDSCVGRICEVSGCMSDSPAIRILAVDDHPMFRYGVAALLASQPDMQLVAEGANGREAIQQFRTHRPDVTLMDLQMPEMSGLEATIAIRAEFPDARIIVLTTYAGDVHVLRALQAGARGYLLKTLVDTELLATIRSVHSGKKALSPEASYQLAEHATDESLTPAEVEVLQLIAAGNANKQIADRLAVTEDTIKGRVKNILSKLGANDRTHAAIIGVTRGIIGLGE